MCFRYVLYNRLRYSAFFRILLSLLPFEPCDSLHAGLPRHRISAIATGVYGYPRDAVARIAVAATCSHLAEQPRPELVTFVCFDEATRDAYREGLG